MAKIQTIRKIVVEDFPEASRELITKLSSVLNPFLDQVITALSKNLTHADNLKGKVYTFQLAAGVSSITVAWEYNDKPTAVYLGNLTKSTGAAPSNTFSLSSLHSDNKITFTLIGLDGSAAHTITVIAQI